MSQFSGWDENKIKHLQQNKKIRGFSLKKSNQENNQRVSKEFSKSRSKEKDWLDWNLMFWANEHAVELQTEHKFHPERQWRFDYAFSAIKVAVEYEGIFKGGKAHTSVTGVMRDVEKYNAAQLLGWRIIRITANNYKTAPQQLNAFLNATIKR